MRKRICIALALMGGGLTVPTAVSAQTISYCKFSVQRMEFQGTPVEQARCLLTPVERKGKLGLTPEAVGQVLESRIGQSASIDKAALGELLRRENLGKLAESLDRPVSITSGGLSARYFVIHDTSQLLRGSVFPSNDSPRLNGLGTRYEDGTWVAHTFLNRKGEILVAYDFEQPWRATRLEGRAGAGTRSRGLFLHVEHNQPRLKDPKGPPKNDYDAPTPGFTDLQYDRSALLYITASARAGRWLIPAFHGVIDKGVGTHDDPQNFDRPAWETAIERRLAQLSNPLPGASASSSIIPLKASLYYTALEADYPAGTETPFRSKSGQVLHHGSREFFDKAAIEGSAKLSDGRVINVDGVVGGERRWKVIPQAFGLDAIGCGLIPFRSAAVDRTVIPLRTRLYLPETVGMPLPDGTAHDGLWYAVDTGSAITGQRIDLFLGAGKATMSVPRSHGLGHLQALQAERRGTFSGCPAR